MLERDAEELSTTPDTTQQLPQVSRFLHHISAVKNGEKESPATTRGYSASAYHKAGEMM